MATWYDPSLPALPEILRRPILPVPHHRRHPRLRVPLTLLHQGEQLRVLLHVPRRRLHRRDHPEPVVHRPVVLIPRPRHQLPLPHHRRLRVGRAHQTFVHRLIPARPARLWIIAAFGLLLLQLRQLPLLPQIGRLQPRDQLRRALLHRVVRGVRIHQAPVHVQLAPLDQLGLHAGLNRPHEQPLEHRRPPPPPRLAQHAMVRDRILQPHLQKP